ncbi:MAG: hypothetical protein MJ075_05735 [Oscillospiraceae bacterium]|nr:hypothetical protein [Oscillospiraceae bacterium]
MNTKESIHSPAAAAEELSRRLQEADKILIGAGAGLSAAAGLSYLDRDAFRTHFPEMAALGYHFQYELVGMSDSDWTRGRKWAYWSTHIHYVRRVFPQASLYSRLLNLVQDKDFFVVTSNADRQFMRAGFPFERLFEYQGHYDNMGCSEHCCRHTWNNEELLEEARTHIDHDRFEVPEEYIPKCPYCGADAEICFRGENYKELQTRYIDFVEACADKNTLLLELGVGFNTPGVIRWPFERLTYAFPHAHLVRINAGYKEPGFDQGHIEFSREITDKISVYDTDAAEVIDLLTKETSLP